MLKAQIYPDKSSSRLLYFLQATSIVCTSTINLQTASNLTIFFFFFIVSGDGQVDFNEFMTILGPKLLSSETREGFLGSTIDTIFWQVKLNSLEDICLLYC